MRTDSAATAGDPTPNAVGIEPPPRQANPTTGRGRRSPRGAASRPSDTSPLDVSGGRRPLQTVINATGILLHDELGRAPLAAERPATYTNLDFDVLSGTSGDRSLHAAGLLAIACQAEDALVVNNGSAAILLVLSALAPGREVIVSRGELAEIGGGFRIAEVMAASGAHLVEVGATNRTRRDDYIKAVTDQTALLLKVHTSNYRIFGSTESTNVAEMAQLGQLWDRDLPSVIDLGSGLLDETCPWLPGGRPAWLADEPGVLQALASGASLVTFSGDELLGGPQAGVIAGRADLVNRCRSHPLARSLRPGGLVLETLQDVAMSYLRRDAGQTLPLWQMATAPIEDLLRRAQALGVGTVVECQSSLGGGPFPAATIPSIGVAVMGDISARLLASSPPVVGRVNQGVTVCDLRTVLPAQDALLARAIAG